MENVTLHLDLPDELAWALAQLLKRIGYSDCRQLAVSDEEAWQMIHATEAARWRASATRRGSRAQGGGAAPQAAGLHAVQGENPPCTACLSVENRAPSRLPYGAARP